MIRPLITAFVRNSVFANILLAGIIFSGALASQFMITEMFPETSVDFIMITVPYPGADPEEVEEGICRKLEENIDGLPGVKQYTTYASENAGVCAVEVFPKADMADVKERVRNAVESISNFPIDAEKPIIEEVVFKSDVLFLVLWGDLNERVLKEWGERIKDEIQALPGVSQVNLAGAREYEIAVELSEERLREYGLSLLDVANAIRAGNLNSPGGTVRGKGEEVRLRTVERKYTGGEFENIVVLGTPAGDIITLDRLATIRDSFTEDPILARFNGKPCVLIQVLSTSDEDALTISNTVTQWVEDRQKQLPPGTNVTVMTDISQHLRARIRLLITNGMIGLTLVFLLLWIFLDFRLSFWVSMGIPISLCGALAIMWAIGASINMISLFGLIMVLGIVVDDAIVMGEAVYVHRKNGEPPVKAAVEAVCEVGMPIIGAVTTTIVAFLPLMFVGGVMGKFIFILPVAVICSLSISLLECLFMFPAHMNHLPDPNREIGPGHPWKQKAARFRRRVSHGMEHFAEHIYAPFAARVVRYRYVSLCVAISVLLVTAGLYEGGFIKYEMFPNVDGDELMAEVTFPDGTPLEVTSRAVAQMEEAFRRVAENTPTSSGKPMIENMLSVVGTNLQEMRDRHVGPQHGAIHIELLKSAERGVHSRDLTVKWEKEMGQIPGALALSITGQRHGPPGASLEIWIQGEEMDTILAASEDLMDKLRSYEGLYQVQSDFRPGKRELRFKLKPEARSLGLTAADLARQVYAGYYGEEALRLQRGRDDIRVKVRYTQDERSRLADLRDVRIRTPYGAEVPLYSVADAGFAPGYSTIKRSDGQRRVAVTSELDSNKITTQEVLRDLTDDYFPELFRKYPGIRMSFEGAEKMNQEALGSLWVGFPLALVGIFVIIATIFRSYLQPIVIMVTVPFGVVGAVFGHLGMGLFKGEPFDLTLMSMFGIVALSGVVVNDAIVLIECVNTLISQGVPFYEAIQQGGAKRFRAIFLTTVTTMGGLLPMILEKDLQAQFLIPMALSIAIGVGFATLLTLLLIPSLLGIVNDARRAWHWLIYREWPLPEAVEPAIQRGLDEFVVNGAKVSASAEQG